MVSEAFTQSKYLDMIKKHALALAEKYNLWYALDDLVSEGKLGYLRGIETYNKRKGSLDKWIEINIKNKMSNFCKYEIKHKKSSDLVQNNVSFIAKKDPAVCAKLKSHLIQLNKLEQYVLKAVILDGRTFGGIAKILKIPKHRIKNLYYNSLNFLKEGL